MSTPIVATKLYIPQPRPNAILRPRLVERLDEGLRGKLTLISAAAGFGKTTLLATWLAELRMKKEEGRKGSNPDVPFSSAEVRRKKEAGINRSDQDVSSFSILNSPFSVAWLSLDKGDNDATRFLMHLVAALQTTAAHIGAGAVAVLQSPQPPRIESLLTSLLNEMASIPDDLVLVLDDYHMIEAEIVDQALAFLVEHLPPRMRLVIATREDPHLPLARLRARGHLTELRVADLRFTFTEAAAFLSQVMGLSLSAEDIATLEARTEGWVAGLQLAALSIQGHQDAAGFIRSFSGSHRFVLDYLLEEVLHQQPQHIQAFLLRTSILDRMCGPLCDAVLDEERKTKDKSSISIVHRPSSIVLQELERANLFIVPLDNERRWYRYHHLFADLLRQRLQQHTGSSTEHEEIRLAELHRRASIWYEDNRLEIEAFQHAAAANDLERAERLIEGKGMPLQFRGAAVPILNWLGSLPTAVLDARPLLWVTYASALLTLGQVIGVEEKAKAAEAALQGVEPNDKNRDLVGRVASIRATVAVTQHQVETIIAQSRRALAYLHPNNLPIRASITWTLGYAYHLQGDRAAARLAYTEALASCLAIGHTVIARMAMIGLGNIQEIENQLYLAAETYRRALELSGDPPPPPTCDAYLGLAHICYQWNDLDAAQQHVQKSIPLAQQIENTDRFVTCEVFLARLKLALGDVDGATAVLAKAEQSVRQHNFVQQMPEVVAVQVLTLLRQGKLAAAAHLAQTHALPISQARVHLAQGNPAAALALLEPARRRAEARGWQDEQLKAIVLQAVAHHIHGEKELAVQRLGEALALAEPGGFIRIFVDEGLPMKHLLQEAASRGMAPEYIRHVLAAFSHGGAKRAAQPTAAAPLVEPLSERELEVLQHIAEGQTDREIAARLYLSLYTVKVHARNIYGKLGVNKRMQAVARARELGILPRS